MFGLGFQELLVILAIILVLFGGTKLPQLSKSVAEVIRDLRKGFTDNLDNGHKEKREISDKKS